MIRRMLGGAALLTMAVAAPALAGEAALWHGGTIITMDGDQPQTVAAVVERDGRIAFAGTEAEARKLAGPAAVDHDLKGATMLPGFVDAHSHFAMAMQVAGGIDLGSARVPVTDHASLIAAVREGIAARKFQPGAWITVWNYNDANFADRRHITRAELDAAFPDVKLIVMHVSGHGLVANSAALAAAGITDATPTPEGGVMTRDAAGRLTGLIFERAMLLMRQALPQPSAAQQLVAFDAVQRYYTHFGYTHAQDGATQLPDLLFFRSPAAREHLRIDLVALPYATMFDWVVAHPEVRFGVYDGHLKLAGIKATLDGSPQARTAWFTRDYALGAPDGTKPWHGQPVMSEAEYGAIAKAATARGLQLFVHANGDAAIDAAIRTFDSLGIKAGDNRRPVVIHSQFMRPDQIAAYARIGVSPAYFTNHTYYFADTHRLNFPKEVVDFISPMQASRAAGLVVSNHSDFPVTGLDPFVQLWSSMARTSQTGVVSGADQRLTAYQGLQALTTGPAFQVFEEDRKGRLKAGLLADFVVLDKNPLATPLDQIRSIKVLETVKEGQTVFKKG
ncbi:MAG: amidohydrolase [Proteobacteria bacterium]|nr:amidohydrolase [Pseudomonadota bacterium]